MVTLGHKPEIMVNGDFLEDDQLLLEWPLVRHLVTGAPVNRPLAEDETHELKFNLGGKRAVFRLGRTEPGSESLTERTTIERNCEKNDSPGAQPRS